MNNISHNEVTFPFRDFLKRERDLHLLSFCTILFLLGVYMLSPSLQSFLSIAIPIFVAFYIAIFSTEYAIFRNKFVEVNSAFKSLFNEIKKNRERIDDILIRIDDIEQAWIRLEKNKWINEKTIVRETYSTKTGFIYQYLPNNALKVIQSFNFDQIILGAENSDYRPNYYQQLSLLYYHFIKTSEETQRIENEINEFIDLLDSQHDPINPELEPKKVIDGSGNIRFETRLFGYEINDFNSLFVNNKFDLNQWDIYVKKKVQEIIEKFKNCRDNQNEECPDIIKMKQYFDFFDKVILKDSLYPPNSITQIIGSKNPWGYLILIPSVFAIWTTYAILIAWCELLSFLLSGLIIIIILFFFVFFFIVCFIIQRLFF